LAVTGRHGSEPRGEGHFDAFDLAVRRAAIEGSFDAQARPRLADRLAPGQATVGYRISGAVDAVGHLALAVELEGEVPLVCQRCLEPFAHPVAQRTLLLLARDEDELEQLDENDEHEVVLAAAALDPLVLAEDELLLTLPYAPRHADGDCPDGGAVADGGHEAGPASAQSPFGSLAALRPRPRSK